MKYKLFEVCMSSFLQTQEQNYNIMSARWVLWKPQQTM